METIHIVSEIDTSDHRAQILDTDAQKLVSDGQARIIGGGDIKPGGELVHLIKVVEEPDPSNQQEQITFERAQERLERAKMRVVGGGDLSVGSDLEKIFERGGN